MEDLFLTLREPVPTKQTFGVAVESVECAEVLRIIGPFPNVRNTLAGQWGFPGYGQDADADAATGSGLELVYDTMIDGNGGAIKAPDGSDRRKVSQSVSQSADPFVHRSHTQSLTHSFNQSINQSLNQSNRSTNERIHACMK